MHIAYKRLPEIENSQLIALMNHPLVRRQMPLLKENFTEEHCKAFIAAKEQLWQEHGYGPWAFVVDGTFAGWGGLQPENGEADLALVLHPDYWGLGKSLYKGIIKKAFGEMGLPSVTVLFPPTHTRVQGLLRLGFVRERELYVDNERFIRYRLWNPNVVESHKS